MNTYTHFLPAGQFIKVVLFSGIMRLLGHFANTEVGPLPGTERNLFPYNELQDPNGVVHTKYTVKST